jgi:hypothetical protein
VIKIALLHADRVIAKVSDYAQHPVSNTANKKLRSPFDDGVDIFPKAGFGSFFAASL